MRARNCICLHSLNSFGSNDTTRCFSKFSRDSACLAATASLQCSRKRTTISDISACVMCVCVCVSALLKSSLIVFGVHSFYSFRLQQYRNLASVSSLLTAYTDHTQTHSYVRTHQIKFQTTFCQDTQYFQSNKKRRASTLHNINNIIPSLYTLRYTCAPSSSLSLSPVVLIVVFVNESKFPFNPFLFTLFGK